MGIKGLHKGLSFCTEKGNMTQFQGRRIAIDTSSWLHKSVYSVSETYVESTERNCVDPKCILVSSRYIRKRCEELLKVFKVAEIFLVMDGKRCPLKVNESAEREHRRQQNLREARVYKRNGRNDKAEEKYKMCIKIKDELTHEVMAEVSKAFGGSRKVSVIWSPYEADAQLAKLCVDQMADAVVTEDSDVLVYSVAARVAFPVIFKLDRTSGVCDIISMAWLLDPPKVQQIGKARSALEGLLLNFASRESKRPGFGARLFVQGCVLAGCDYAHSLPGMGLVSSMKSCRNHSFRNEEVRFKKILESLPKKSKQNIDIDAYEATLAKSEAVFYYHVVLHTNGHKKHIAVPRLSNEGSGTGHCATDHSPLLGRFGDELNFLGEIDTSRLQSARNAMPPQHASSDNRKPLQPSNSSKKPISKWFQPVTKMKNPYSSDANSTNLFLKSNHKTNTLTSNIQRCNELPDTRYAKRVFPTFTADTSNHGQRNQQNLLSSTERKVGKSAQCSAGAFEYGADEDDSGSVCVLDLMAADNGKKEAVVFGTDDAYRIDEIHDENDCIIVSRVEKQAGTKTLSDTSECTIHNQEQHKDYISDLGDSDFSPPLTVHASSEADEVLTESRFFAKSSARRITLEPADVKDTQKYEMTGQNRLDLQGRKRRKNSRSIASSRESTDSFLDDVVDSPSVEDCVQQRPYKVGRKLGAPKTFGAIEAGFAKQRKRSSFEGVCAGKKVEILRPSASKSRGQVDCYFKPRSLYIANP
ncbi:unnamed protein product [Cylindrotheca closterium]|uniref:Exonuclease 1 n=1 Tax=Cylindrotheca closterium TaxID=2856 RepID=A0AAD2CR39_9STRA|nr:unnamed protein product [Cylindrotheca closterium]